jgi:hypothetical protein
MKKGSAFLIGIVILTLLVSALYGCSKSVEEMKSGIYVAKDKLSSLSIGNGRTFRLNRNAATDYDPTGYYILDGNKLVLQVNGDEKEAIEFIISGDTLIFQWNR